MFSQVADQLRIATTIANQSASTANGSTLAGSAVDIGEMEGPILVRIDAPVCTSGETMTFKVQHSYTTTAGDFTDVPAAALLDPATGAADTFDTLSASAALNQTLQLQRDLLRRYIRVLGTAAGDGTPTYIVNALVIGLKKYT